MHNLKRGNFILILVVIFSLITLSSLSLASAEELSVLPSGKSPDFDSNGIVGLSDFFMFSDEFGKEVTADNEKFDVNYDSKIDFDDFFVFTDWFGKKTELKSDFSVSEEAYFNKLDQLIEGPCLHYTGDRDRLLNKKSYSVNTSIVGTPYSSTGVTGFYILENKGEDCLNYGYIKLNNEMEEVISKLYPDGNVQVKFTITINKVDSKPDLDFLFYNIGEVIYKKTHTIKFTPYKDNYEYKIGIIQAVAPDYDIDTRYICLNTDSLGRKNVYQNNPNETCEDLPYVHTCPGCKLESVKKYDLINSDKLFSQFEVTYSDGPYYSNIYSLKQAGTFWLNLLDKHGIRDITRLRRNPSISTELLGPFKKESDFAYFGEKSKKQRYFREIVEENNIELGKYDFVIYVYYSDQKAFQAFQREASYLSYPLDNQDLFYANRGYISVVHELGHYLFRLRDLYRQDGGLFYPEGVPYPFNFPNEYTCIMAGSRGLTLNPSGDFVASTEQEPNPDKHILCVEDIVQAIGHENPDCSKADFYAGRCGNCTSLNYMGCKRKES